MKTLFSILCCGLFVCAGCAGAHNSNSGEQHLERIKLWHVVIVHLNNPDDAEARQRLIDASHTFRQIKGVEAVYVGKMIPGDRPHQDSSFDVGIAMGFRSKEDLAAYATDPIHLKAVNGILKPLARDWTIYDFANE